MKKGYIAFAALCAAALASCTCPSAGEQRLRPSEYVSTLVGTQSDFSLSTGNTYPAIALPWGMNFWTPQTGKMGDGWAYTYGAHQVRGFKQTHQPSPWINDYGQFSLMPVRGEDKFDEESRASWFSHQSEVAKPYYYKTYLADHDIRVEITPTDRAAMMRFTFPDSKESGVVIDAFDRGSQVGMVDDRTIVGYTTRNSGGVPENFRNWFVVRFDTPFSAIELTDAPGGYKPGSNLLYPEGQKSVTGEHAVAKVHFATRRGQQICASVASSFISPEQALQNLRELGSDDFETVKSKAQARWDDVLGRIEVEGGTDDQYRTFYSCLYRSVLFPRKFYEVTDQGEVVHYSPYNGEVLPGYMYTDTGFWDTFRSLFPLLNLVYPSVNAEIQQGLANAARESGFLPEWASPGHRGCMVGNNSASVVADAVVKGTNDKDLGVLYDAMVYAT
ncbi:MAG: GH92 family glycosyl hydrolase, partial [Alistipes sp.]|nr:GH92 family glycosyl hydrolase [Alistipes sp.]